MMKKKVKNQKMMANQKIIMKMKKKLGNKKILANQWNPLCAVEYFITSKTKLKKKCRDLIEKLSEIYSTSGQTASIFYEKDSKLKKQEEFYRVKRNRYFINERDVKKKITMHSQ